VGTCTRRVKGNDAEIKVLRKITVSRPGDNPIAVNKYYYYCYYYFSCPHGSPVTCYTSALILESALKTHPELPPLGGR
jgi:hypothetical protein